MSAHKTPIANAAILVLAQKGARGFTHRAVDDYAGVPEGTTSRYARTRDALYVLVADAVFELDREALAPLMAGMPLPWTTAKAIDWLVMATTMLLQAPERYLARLELQLEAKRSPALRQHFQDSRSTFVGRLSGVLGSVGVASPDAHADVLVALLDGLLHRQVILGEPLLSTAQMRHVFSRYIA